MTGTEYLEKCSLVFLCMNSWLRSEQFLYDLSRYFFQIFIHLIYSKTAGNKVVIDYNLSVLQSQSSSSCICFICVCLSANFF